MEWQKVNYKKKEASPVPKKLTDFLDPEAQDGRHSFQHEVPEAFHTPPPLSQSNRFAPLSTPHYRREGGDWSDFSEGEEDRDRSPLKPSRPARHAYSNTRSGPKRTHANGNQRVYAKTHKTHGEHEKDSTMRTRRTHDGNTHSNVENDGDNQQQPRDNPTPNPKNPGTNQEEVIPDPLMSFPASNQPITQDFFTQFMLSFRGTIRDDMSEMKDGMSEMKADMKTLAGHVAHFAHETDNRIKKLENRIVEMTEAHNSLIDAHKSLMDEVKWMKGRIVDSEDRNRRNNVRFRGVPENVTTDELKGYVQDILKKTLPSLKEADLVIDRAHRLPRPGFIPKHVPRDVIARVHFFHAKEQLLSYTRGGKKLPEPYKDLLLFQDLSQATLQARRELAPITNTLRYKNIPYSWGFPTKLIINDQGVSHVVKDLKEGKELLYKWNIPIVAPRDPSKDRSPASMPTKPAFHQPMDTTKAPEEGAKSAEA